MRTCHCLKPVLLSLATFAVSLFLPQPVGADDDALKIYLLIGQSNMEGQAYAQDIPQTGPGTWNVPTIQNLLELPNYTDSLPDEFYSFKPHLEADWLAPRDDVWGVHYNSATGANLKVKTDLGPSSGWPSGVQPLQPGMGVPNSFPSTFGAELAMGHRLGDELDAPILMLKSSKGGTDLAVDWRPPSAVADRGGPGVGANYTNTVNLLFDTLNTLDADLSDNGVLDDYNNATSYEIASLVWLQGWNTTNGNQSVYTTGQKIAEYDANLADLIEDIRAFDPRIADDLPAIVVESTDQNASLNGQRAAAVDALNAVNPGSAIFLETNGLKGVNYGGLNSIGGTFSNNWGFHFHARAENFLEIGWKIGDTAVANGYVGTAIPEPSTLLLGFGFGGIALLRRRR